jgi:hypothetical protein
MEQISVLCVLRTPSAPGEWRGLLKNEALVADHRHEDFQNSD